MIRIGLGYDIHPLKMGRDLILGGIKIPFEKGLDGDSDADVLTHAIIDAILGALALGDIGTNYGVGTPEVMGISSIILLERTYEKLITNGFHVVNIDTTIIAQTPKLMPHVQEMRKKLSTVLYITPDLINIKSTTPKRLGFLGTGAAIAVHAVVLIEKPDKV